MEHTQQQEKKREKKFKKKTGNQLSEPVSMIKSSGFGTKPFEKNIEAGQFSDINSEQNEKDDRYFIIHRDGDNDNEDSSSSMNIKKKESDSEYEPPIINEGKEESKYSASKMSIDQDDAEEIQKISPNLDIPYGDLKLKTYPQFANRSKNDMLRIKSWYKYRYNKFNKGKTIKVKHPKRQSSKVPLFPPQPCNNEILKGLIKEDLPEDQKNFLALCLEQYLPNQHQKYFTNVHLEQFLAQIKQMESLQEIRDLLLHTPVSVRLKATAQAILLFNTKVKEQDDQGYMITWFNNCIKPALGIAQQINYKQFEKKEIQVIVEVCKFNGPNTLSDVEAKSYLQLLKHGCLLNLDDAYRFYSEKADDFWTVVLNDICNFSSDITTICVKNKESMITQAIYEYNFKYTLEKFFAKHISLFQKMSFENIQDLAMMQQRQNFNKLIHLLDHSRIYDFNQFQYQAETYLMMENRQQVSAWEKTLKDVPLENWLDYKNTIISSEMFLEDDKSLQLVEEELYRMMAFEKIAQISESNRIKLEDNYKAAFKNLNSKIILRDFQWQKELVLTLAYLVHIKSKRNILVLLGTGHGKSVVIQLLADILYQLQGNVSIVTLNRFLSFWGKKTYQCSNWKNVYYDIEGFLKRVPSDATHVIYDEIDQMLGLNSFKVLGDEQNVTASYVPSIMKKWKSIIGFSGTLSVSTIDQLREELKDPIVIQIPTLRRKGVNNIFTDIQKVPQENKVKAVAIKISETKKRYKNTIVIMKDVVSAEKLINDEEFQQITEDKSIYTFFDFTQNFAEIEVQLKQLMKDNFVVVTTEDGGRGVDFKGISVAHVIIGFDPSSYAQAIQCLGRGARDINTYTEGTIIADNPIILDPMNYLNSLETRDGEKAMGLVNNCRIARLLHGQTHQRYDNVEGRIQKFLENSDEEKENPVPHLTMIMFQTFMEDAKDFCTSSNGEVLWRYLKKLDKNNLMPDTPFQDWNA